MYRLSSLALSFAFVAMLATLSAWAADASNAKIEITSPDSRFVIELALGEGGRPVYRVDRMRDAVIQPSGLGFMLTDGIDLTRGFDSIELVDNPSITTQKIFSVNPKVTSPLCWMRNRDQIHLSILP